MTGEPPRDRIPRPVGPADMGRGKELSMAAGFLDQLVEGVLVFDGAMGTRLQEQGLSPRDFGSPAAEGCYEALNLHRPEAVEAVHEEYFAAGADAVETNSLGANAVLLEEFGLADRVREINRQAALIARGAAERSPGSSPRFVSGSVGPTSKLPTLGQVPYSRLAATYEDQVIGLLEGGVDLLQVETCQDPLQVKAALVGCGRAFRAYGHKVPVLVQLTIEQNGTMLLGTEIGAALTALRPFEVVDALGLNCGVGPDRMVQAVRYLSRNSTLPIAVMPNAGIPENRGGEIHYPMGPEELARALAAFVREEGVRLVGGCCGTTPEHIRALARAVRDVEPGRVEVRSGTEARVSSLFSEVSLRQEPAPLQVGERCNATGSRRFRRLLEAGDLDGAVALAREQEEGGAHVVDLSVARTGGDELGEMVALVPKLAQVLHAPLMIDTTDHRVLEAALCHYPGRTIVNSVSLEQGREGAEQVLGLVKEHGAAVVALAIDEGGMARTTEAKWSVVRRIYELATEEFGLAPEALLFDPLTFSLGSGDPGSRRAGVETLEALERIAAQLPRCQTILGVSNVSFGLGRRQRMVLNSVFLHHAVERGLCATIVDPGKILPLSTLDQELIAAAEDLIFDRDPEALTRYLHLFGRYGETEFGATGEAGEEVPPREALRRRVLTGNRAGLEPLIEGALGEAQALELLNDLLLPAMKEVGDLFARGRMQLPFVLQAAEVMRRAVELLTPHMEKSSDGERGTVVLATVRGDVHDIGKNLADILLTNNGYRVVNLGIRQPIGSIVDAALEHKADAIGLSGLLVKSTEVMREDLEELNRRGLERIPVILGGAALSRRFVETDLRSVYRGRVFYAGDAFDGLRIMEELLDRETLSRSSGCPAASSPDLPEPHHSPPHAPELEKGDSLSRDAGERTSSVGSGGRRSGAQATERGRSTVRRDVVVPEPPFWGTKVVDRVPLDEVFELLNTRALFSARWRFKRGRLSEAQIEAELARAAWPTLEALKARVVEERILEPKVAFGYFPAVAEGEELVVLSPESGGELARLSFPRQVGREGLCITDYFRSARSGKKDLLAVQAVTVGPKASAACNALFEGGEYRDYFMLHGFSVETAEALAEHWHRVVRRGLGLAGEESPDRDAVLRGEFRGCRYSYGYPACPDLEGQAALLDLVGAEDIGIELTDGLQMVPEQSTAAIVVHHPQAKYFSVVE